MKLIDRQSLGVTVDNINAVLFTGEKLSKKDSMEAAEFIVSRRGMQGSYEGMFAPLAGDFEHGLTLFTGEKVTTRVGTSHILGEEATRALLLLNCSEKTIQAAIQAAAESMTQKMQESLSVRNEHRHRGEYCCGKCTVSVWRNVLAGGLASLDRQKVLDAGLKALEQYRDEKGKWRSYPYYYTLLALAEMDSASAKKEMQYAAPGLEHLLKRTHKQNSKYESRRIILAERVLAKC